MKKGKNAKNKERQLPMEQDSLLFNLVTKVSIFYGLFYCNCLLKHKGHFLVCLFKL